MNILMCINNAFVDLAIQTLQTISFYNKEKLEVYIIYQHLSKKTINKIDSFLNQENIGQLHAIPYDFEKYDFPISISHITRETYFRLYAPYILPSTINRILYLDCDIICCGSIIDYYNMEFDNNIIIGTQHYDYNRGVNFNTYINEKLGLPKNNPYINAGVLLINLEKWRNHITIKDINNYISNNYDNLECQDQDVINKLFYSYIKIVSDDYNYQINYIPTEELNYENKKLIHYLDSPKPWQEHYYLPFQGIPYYRYLYKTQQYEFLNNLLLSHFKNSNMDIYGINDVLNLIFKTD